MAGTLLCPLTCGFAKVAAYNAFLSSKDLRTEENEGSAAYTARKFRLRFEKYNQFFGEKLESFDIPLTTFNKKLPDFIAFMNKWKSRKQAEKEKYLKCFSLDSWRSLSNAKKNQHQLKACKGCSLNYSEIQAMFPVRSRLLKKFAKENPFVAAKEVLQKEKPLAPLKPKQLQEVTLKLYNTVNNSFENTYGTDFATAQTKVTKIGIQYRPSKAKTKTERRKNLRTAKKSIEESWGTNDVACFLQTRQSYAKRLEQRLLTSFESRETAKHRTIKRKCEEAGQRAKKRHSPDPSTIDFDKEALLAEVNTMKEGDQINYTTLASKYISEAVPKPNAGAVVKEFLTKSGVDLSRFKTYHKTAPSIRRSLLRGPGGEISIPTPATNKDIKEKLEVKIKNKEYILGELIVPRKYKKLVLAEDGKSLKEECFTVSGRKIPLIEIRRRLMAKHEKLGIVRKTTNEEYDKMTASDLSRKLQILNENTEGKTDQQIRQRLMSIERTRHLSIWHDHSKVMNRGHMVFMVNALYDEALYYTDKEMENMGFRDVNVQYLVEKPHIYIIGQSSDSEAEQLAYVETRLECLKMMNLPVKTLEGIAITDHIRLFVADHPAQEFECGEIKGGNDGCAGCKARSPRYNDLTYCFRSEQLSLSDRQAIVFAGIHGRKNRNGGVKPFYRLTRKELEEELLSRGLLYRDIMNKGKNDLETLLREMLGGVQRVPALMFEKQPRQTENVFLKSYEICPCEPLHDIKGHIKNIITELPKHLKAQELVAFEEARKMAFQVKQQLRGCDYRKAVLILASYLDGKLRENVQFLLNSLAEISRLLYLPAQKRNQKEVLRFHNTTFLHAIAMTEIIKVPKEITQRVLYGIYFHSIVCHAPQVLRIIAPSSTNSEKQERIFGAINGICNATSSGRPGQIVDNVLIRLQAEDNGHIDCMKAQESDISRCAKALPELGNSIISRQSILKYKNDYQAHLERVSDFLLCGPGVWWQEVPDGVEFFDGPSEPACHNEGPPLHHFRSSNLKMEEKYLHDCWNKLTSTVCVNIPHPHIKLYNSDGNRIGELCNQMWKGESMASTTEISDSDNPMPIISCCSSSPDPDNTLETQEEHITSLELVEGSDVTSDTENDIKDIDDAQQHVVEDRQVNKNCSSNAEASKKRKPTATTTLGKNIAKILGETRLVLETDGARKRWKNSPNNSYLQEQYLNSLTQVQTEILKEYGSLKTEIERWEQDYFLQKGNRVPLLKDIRNNTHANTLYKKFHLSKKLLEHWEITAHL